MKIKHVRYLPRLLAVFLIFVCCAPAYARDISIGATEWPPFTSSELEGGGFMIEITRRAFEETGHRVTVKISPWKRVFDATKKGQHDALIGASYTEERTGFFIYPDWHFTNHISLFTRQGRADSYNDLSDLCPAKVGVLRGSWLVDELSRTPCFEVTLFSNIDTYVDLLLSGRIDMFAEAAVTVRHMFEKRYADHLDTISEVTPPLHADNVYTVFSKQVEDAPELALDFDRGIRILKETGELSEILERYGLSQ